MIANRVSSSQQQHPRFVSNQTTPTGIQSLNGETVQVGNDISSYGLRNVEEQGEMASLESTAYKSDHSALPDAMDGNNHLECPRVLNRTKPKTIQASPSSITEDCSPQKRRERRQKRKKKKSLTEIFFV